LSAAAIHVCATLAVDTHANLPVCHVELGLQLLDCCSVLFFLGDSVGRCGLEDTVKLATASCPPEKIFMGK